MTTTLKARDAKKNPAQAATQLKTIAQDLYERLVSEGFETRDVISVSSQLLGFASAHLAEQKSATNG